MKIEVELNLRDNHQISKTTKNSLKDVYLHIYNYSMYIKTLTSSLYYNIRYTFMLIITVSSELQDFRSDGTLLEK